MAKRSSSAFAGVKSYPKERLKVPSLAGPPLPLPKLTMGDYSSGSPLKLTGTEGPLVLDSPKPRKPKLPRVK